ncbi:ABC transporter ATP-binding protein [Noviherbaspirillum massiliense]|uniref:ABC transporter ATP-binding protein n=1 Tax=Noviherbaspirillum massiliense TaxID=1465823 RepID=UPI000304B64D|nr:ABC transporter ATP-binding protein [Noviherbaspirillum massiliense]
MRHALLSTESLHIRTGEKLLCDGLNLHVHPGEFWCIVGKNGAGKSTLLHTLAGLREPQHGRILLDGSDIRGISAIALARCRGLLAQQQFDAFSSSVLDTVMAGRHPYQSGFGWESDADRTAARSALAAVGMAGAAHKDVVKLSGGERQRVALATLLAQDPDLLLLDEPTAHQDAAAQLAVMRLMQEMLARNLAPGQGGKAIIAACHDINLVSRFATHVLMMADGRHWLGPAEEMLLPPLLHEVFGCTFEAVQTAQGRLFFPL